MHRISLEQKRGNKFVYLKAFFCFTVAAFFKTIYLYSRFRYRIIHVHNVPDTLVLCALVPRFLGTKIILDMHEIMPEFFMRKYQVPETSRAIALLKIAEKISIKLAHHVFVATPFLKATVIKRSTIAEKVTVLLNLPELKYFMSRGQKNAANDLKPIRFKLIYAGTLSHIHGVDLAIHAVRKLVANGFKNLEFHLYGLGDEEHNLKKMVSEFQLDDHVFFYQSVHMEEMGKILSSMDVGIVPKRNGVFIGEAISTKLFDYAAAGLAAVCSQTAGDTIYFNDTMVQFFEPENIDDLADKIYELYQNPDRRYALINNSLSLIKQFSWDGVKSELHKIYLDL
ncbi:MAG: glycosyltransferase family 4 protein, partial [bacterium]|nr:glycosyltransferase family 4 protein [bacterium]